MVERPATTSPPPPPRLPPFDGEGPRVGWCKAHEPQHLSAPPPHPPPRAAHPTNDPSPSRGGRRGGTAGTGTRQVEGLEREKREAATNPEFEKAARLRDEVKRLREMELDVVEGEGD